MVCSVLPYMSINVWEFLKPNRPLEMTVWSDESDEEGQTFQSKIDDVGNGRFFLRPPMTLFENLKLILTHGMLVGVTMNTDKGPIIFYPKMAVCQAEPAGFWFAAPPDTQAELVFRREFIRVDFERTLKIDVPGNQNNRWDSLTVKAEDLSGGGMKFFCSRLLPKNLRFYIYLQLTDDTPPLKMDARIVASSEVTPESEAPPNLKFTSACQFMDISEAHQTAVVGECFRLQLARNRKNNQ